MEPVPDSSIDTTANGTSSSLAPPNTSARQRSSSNAGGTVPSANGTNTTGAPSTSSTNSNNATNKRTPSTVIPAAAFVDTFSILLLFSMLPSPAMFFVHLIFIATGITALRTLSALSQSITLDLVLAITTLYLWPQIRQVVAVFAHAIVAASLGGGPKGFTNAIYSTMLAVTIHWISERIGGGGRMISSDSVRHHFDHRQHNYTPFPFVREDDRGFNTLTTIWSMIPGMFRSIRRIDWAYELPLIIFQTVAIHVVLLAIVPFFRRMFPDRVTGSGVGSSSSSSNVKDSGIVEDWPSQSGPGTHNFDDTHDDYNRTVISFADCQDEPVDRGFGADLNILAPPRKNKRLATVRANQPLWSTLASSMVLAARQESERLRQDGISKAPLPNAHEDVSGQRHILGSCSLRFIFENLVAFELSGFDVKQKDSFIVRVNGIAWPQVTVYSDEEQSDSPFLAVVHGLTPLTQYDIEVVCVLDDDRALTCQHVDVCTIKRANSSQPSGPTTRPLSPVTTLLDTLASTQNNLSEEKTKLKKMKREYQKRLSALRGEIDGITSKIDSADKGDERNRRKVLSLRESVRQFEEEIRSSTAEIESLEQELETFSQGGNDELKAQHQSRTALAREHATRLQAREEELTRTIADRQNELGSLNARIDRLDSKRHRLSSDNARIGDDYKNEFAKEMERRTKNRQTKLERRRKVQTEFSNSITKMESTIDDTRQKTMQLYLQLQQVNTANAVAAQQQQSSNSAGNVPPDLAPSSSTSPPQSITVPYEFAAAQNLHNQPRDSI